MKLFCEGLDLSDAVLKVIKAASVRTTNPILEGIKLSAQGETLTLLATDGELAIEKKIHADIKEEGETVVLGKLFSEFVKKLSNEQIELEMVESQLKIKYTDSQVFLQCLNVQEFPNIQKINNAQFFTIKQSDLKDIINKTVFSVAMDDSRPILKGCLFEITKDKLKSVALDGYRIAISEKPITECSAEQGVVIPGRSLNEISKLLEDNDEQIKVLIQRNYLMVQVNNTKIITRLLGTNEDYINYKQIIPTTFSTTLVVNKNQLQDALERTAILSRASNDNSVKFDIQENLIVVLAKSEIGNVTEKITASLTGNVLQITFDNFFFTECLRTVNDEFIKLQFNEAINPCVIAPQSANKDYLFLLLPMKTLY